MRRIATRVFISVASAVSLCSMLMNPTLRAAVHPTFSEKQITLDGTTYSRPYGFVHNHTTYMPVWYVMQVLSQLQVTNVWKNNTWSMMTPSFVNMSYKQLTTGLDGAKITVNGHLEERVPKIVATDPASGQETTFMPIWYVMQLLKQFQIKNTWDGHTWKLDTSSSVFGGGTTSQSGGSENGGSSGTQVGSQVEDDSSYFSRASNNLYVSAQTGDPASSTPKTTSMNDVQPGQNVYLFAWHEGQSVDSRTTTWFVNSKNASVSPDVTHHYSVSNSSGVVYTVAAGVFRANAPGVYTIQAETAGQVYSVPLVVIVGLNSSWNQPVNSAQDLSGVRPFDASNAVPLATKSNGHGTSFSVYNATSDGWIPIQGHTTSNHGQVQVTFGNNPGIPEWSYAIPVDGDGNFAAEVRAPVTGMANLTLFTNYTGDLTNWANGKAAIDNPQTVSVQVSATVPSSANVDVHASAKMDYNLNPALGTLAEGLMNQAGSVDSGIEAINNYVAEDIIYDNSELQPDGYRFQDSAKTWTTKLGVCEDFAELEASMLKAIGIRTETVQGVAVADAGVTDPTIGNGDNHEWLKIYDGNQWILADPTWSSADTKTTDWLNNEFFTNTTEFASTHKADPSAIGSSE